MAGVHRLDVTEDVRQRQTTFLNTTVEVVLVAFRLLALIQASLIFDCVLVLIPVFINRGAGNLATIHKQPSLCAFEQNPVVTAAGDMHFHAGSKGTHHVEVVRCVVAVVLRRVTAFEWHRMFGISPVNGYRTVPFFMLVQGPGGDVDMMSPPVGEFAAGILVPPAEFIVAIGVATSAAIFGRNS